MISPGTVLAESDLGNGGGHCSRRRFLFSGALALLAIPAPLCAQREDITQADADFLRTAIETIEKHSLRSFSQPEILAGAHAELKKALGPKYRASFPIGIPPGADLDLAGNIFVDAVRKVARAAPANVREFAVRALMERSLNLFLATIDEYSEFIPSSAAPDLIKIDRAVEYVGIGVALTRGDGGLVCTPNPGENASLAGVRKGDLLLRIDGRETREMTIYEAIMRLRGNPKTTVRIRVRHAAAEGDEEDLPIERAKVQHAPVEIRPDRGFGHHIRISAITPTTAKALRQEFLALGPDKAVLLDLRGNEGGGFDDAVRVAELFLPKGTPVATLYRRGQTEKSVSENATPYVPSKLTILQDGHTASGAELIIAALTAYAPLHARTLGTQTYGKGVAQDSILLKQGEWGMVIITSFKMHGPNNEDWNGNGILPKDEIPGELAR